MSALLSAFALNEHRAALRLLFIQPIHDAMNSVLDQSLAEIDHQPESFVSLPQIGQPLSREFLVVIINCFDFDDDLLLDDHVNFQSLVQFLAFVSHLETDLSPNA